MADVAAARLRLFVALGVPDAAADVIARLQQRWRDYPGLRARFTRREHLHLTLKFLGEVDEAAAAGIGAALATVRAIAPTVSLGAAGVFTARREPRILWLHLAGTELVALQQAVDAALAPHYPAERQFMSHLTIARLQSVADRRTFPADVAACAVPPVTWTASEFALTRSVLTPTGPVYTILRRYPLEAAPSP
jgi:2'-5' RNA ligase